MRARPPRRTMRSPPCGRHANAGSPSPDNALLTAFFRSLLALAQVVLRDLDGRSDPDVLLGEDVLDEPLDHAHARRAADHLRMAHQVEEAALLVRALEFFLPDVEDVLLAPDAVADRRDRAEAELDPVVIAPRGGQ